MVKKRGIAKKPAEQSAADWVNAGGTDPEIESTSEPTKTSKKNTKPKAKSSDPSYKQIGVYVPKETHKQMKIGSAITGLDLSEIAAAGIDLWLAQNVPAN